MPANDYEQFENNNESLLDPVNLQAEKKSWKATKTPLANGKFIINLTTLINEKPVIFSKEFNDTEFEAFETYIKNKNDLTPEQTTIEGQKKVLYDLGFREKPTSFWNTFKSNWMLPLANSIFTVVSTGILMSPEHFPNEDSGKGIWTPEWQTFLVRGLNAFSALALPILYKNIQDNIYAREQSTTKILKGTHHIIDLLFCFATLGETFLFNPLDPKVKWISTIKEFEAEFLNQNSSPFLLQQIIRATDDITNLVALSENEKAKKIAENLSTLNAKASPWIVGYAFTRIILGINTDSLPNTDQIKNSLGIFIASLPAYIGMLEDTFINPLRKADIQTNEEVPQIVVEPDRSLPSAPNEEVQGAIGGVPSNTNEIPGKSSDYYKREIEKLHANLAVLQEAFERKDFETTNLIIAQMQQTVAEEFLPSMQEQIRKEMKESSEQRTETVNLTGPILRTVTNYNTFINSTVIQGSASVASSVTTDIPPAYEESEAPTPIN